MQTVHTHTDSRAAGGLKWRVKSWFCCLKLPAKLKSWTSKDKTSSTEMAGTERCLPWALSRLSFCLLLPHLRFYWSQFVSPWLMLEVLDRLFPALRDERVWVTGGCYSLWILSGHCLLAQPSPDGCSLPPPPELQRGFATLSQNPKCLVSSFSWKSSAPVLLTASEIIL